MNELNDLLADFLAETLDIIEKLKATTDALRNEPQSQPILDSLFRGVHTVKGGSGMFNYENTKKLAHELENKLSEWKKRTTPVTADEISHVFTQIDEIEALLKNKDQPKIPATQGSVDPQKPATSAAVEDHIRVSAQRISETMNGVSEIFLIRNQLVYLVEKLRKNPNDLSDYLQNWEILDGDLRRAIGEVERAAMSMRMVTVQSIFTRMSRVIQSYAGTSQKQIRCKTEGEENEFDKKILDTLGEPLIHLVRNAMDHGVEPSSERVLKGKREGGTITLRAYVQGNEAVFQVSDDGQGMDPQKILASARKKGLDVSQAKDDASILNLIFLPGFSTAEVVSDISGRGVGMDAVRTSVHNLGGKLSIETKLNEGSTFTIQIPLNLSLVPVVQLEVNGLKYAVPNSEILEVRTLSPDQIQNNAGRDFVKFRSQFIPCMDLRKTLPQCTSLHEEETVRECPVVIFKTGKSELGVRVSVLDRNSEVIIKPLPQAGPKLEGVTGVAVLPTGEPIFILSLSKIFQSSEIEVSNAA